MRRGGFLQAAGHSTPQCLSFSSILRIFLPKRLLRISSLTLGSLYSLAGDEGSLSAITGMDFLARNIQNINEGHSGEWCEQSRQI